MPKTVEDLTAEARQIVLGDVVEVTSFWDDPHELIKSRIVVAVDQYLLGEGTGLEVLQMSGGTVDDVTLYVSVLPVFEVGDHVLLFLGDSEIRLVQSYQGAYLTDGVQVVRMAPPCARVVESTLQPLTEFLDEIQRALPPGITLPNVPTYTGDFQLPLGGLRYSLCGFSWAYQTNPMGENYVINPNCADGSAGDATSQQTQIQNGAAAWNSAGADFAFTYGGTSSGTSATFNGVNLIYFDTTPPGGGGYVAATYYWQSGGNMTECDLVFNDQSYTWWNGSGRCSNKMDIWDIATHELGHFLCLLDLYGGGDTAKTMYGYVSYCDIHARDLHSDDISGIIAIYGSGGDTTPPTPNPMSFSTTPYGYGPTEVRMTATLATDAGSPPVEYQFDFVSGGTGGTDSAWQTSRDYADAGLSPDSAYTYRVWARDSAATPNYTGYSSPYTTYTLANVPAAPVLSAVDCTSMNIDVAPNGNPAATAYSIQCTATAPTDSNWNGKYVSATGAPSAAAVWRTDAQWALTLLTGMGSQTNYTFQVTARNQNLIPTAAGPSAARSTSKCGDSDMDGGNGDVDLRDFALWQLCFGVTPVGPSCVDGDSDGDGVIDLQDYAVFYTRLLGPD
ncbi:MAG: matrixin family metalloprotease [Planctomycetota bacterium]